MKNLQLDPNRLTPLDAYLDFKPDSAHINALPEPIRKFIHDLETRCDPAGDIHTIHQLREENEALRGLLEGRRNPI